MEKYDITVLAEKLYRDGDLTDDELSAVIESGDNDDLLFTLADKVRRDHYGDEVYLRGLIEFTNACKNDCFYCGIRRSNRKLERYRLTREQIMDCCKTGYMLGYRTFVLQGGENQYFTDDRICEIISDIHSAYPDCAVTLSIGEKSRDSYERYFAAGARRYLLRHETADDGHYRRLHPSEMSPDNRKRCLFDLKEIGYQVGSGFMVGSPFQTTENIITDLRFLQQLQPDMIGIGPFIRHPDTPFSEHENGSLELTLRLIAILRLMFPYALIPATTALGSIHPKGREMGLKAGANVIMPNLSPTEVRELYLLYENKICTGENAALCKSCLENRVHGSGYSIAYTIGDVRR
ncbi:MAG: [FeFe] hydrogenase H-cluster radical SAM maturase HydE [Oscillospiraceae bacterium]|nr:[FeFe] hydrogenase H-cluster radical SAM maturase HydE [Oscillospiraceae bacterium]